VPVTDYLNRWRCHRDNIRVVASKGLGREAEGSESFDSEHDHDAESPRGAEPHRDWHDITTGNAMSYYIPCYIACYTMLYSMLYNILYNMLYHDKMLHTMPVIHTML
jgi:hypothetical protein